MIIFVFVRLLLRVLNIEDEGTLTLQSKEQGWGDIIVTTETETIYEDA